MLAELKRAAPDGRTLGFSTSSPFAVYPHIYTKLDYDPVADFTPIAGVSWFDVGIAVSSQTGATSMRELIDWARRQPGGEIVYGASPGTGSSSHFLGIAVALATGLKMTVVPYKDTGQGVADLVSGRIPILITGLFPMVEMHRAGKLRLVATSADQRSVHVPDVQTLKEAGLDVGFVAWAGVYGPARMPAELVARLEASILPNLTRPEVRDRLIGQGMTPQPMVGQQLAAFLEKERSRFQGLVKASGYVPETS
jgi:tripartite-type tricarboxylate transporter receptor subunit TctC